MSVREDLLYLGGAVVLVGIAGYVLWRNAGGIAGAASDAAGGAIQSAGEAIGVPKTDAQLCEAALASDDLWSVSKYCPAATFIKASGNRLRGLTLDGRPGALITTDQSEAESARLARSGARMRGMDGVAGLSDPSTPVGFTGGFAPQMAGTLGVAGLSDTSNPSGFTGLDAVDSNTALVYDSPMPPDFNRFPYP